MDNTYTFPTVVSYWDVDREKKLTLRGLFRFMQEAAILHAEQFNVGARSVDSRRTSWVLNRVSALVTRYPTHGEPVRTVTWSSGIRAFKGFRDYRLYCGDELIVSASSLWLHVDPASMTLTRVPKDLADRFPSGGADAYLPDLDKHKLAPPAKTGNSHAISLRYSDFDENGHLNNTAYLDLLQTALVKRELPPRPRLVDIQFVREVPPAVEAVHIGIEARESAAGFRVDGPSGLFAHGSVDFWGHLHGAKRPAGSKNPCASP